jgi:DNA-binding CsgD family transcriptional regulator
MEVLALVGKGLQNVEIAQRLFLSERTVHSHISSILKKLGVRTRGQASAEAERLGVGSPGQNTASTIGPYAAVNADPPKKT